MINQIYRWFNRKYPQNFIIKHEFVGSALSAVFCLIFLLIYRPLGVRESELLSYPVTMAIYCFCAAISIVVMLKILRSISYFSDKQEWTILKECLSILFVLTGLGIFIYFTAFGVEGSSNRWNFATFFDSCKYAFLIGAIPFLFFSVMNSRHFYVYNTRSESSSNEVAHAEQTEEIIQIESKLKKEKLHFYPNQFLYASSDGNYVIFYLYRNSKVEKEMIRNSISNIEEQLSSFPQMIRTHRAFIVNIKKVYLKKGNALGYQLKLTNIDHEIPVSRQNIKTFDREFDKLT